MVDGYTPAVFFDRDGTIMHDANYCSDPKDVHVFPFVAESLRKLRAAGFKLIMVTNQSGIGRGIFTPEQYNVVHTEVLRQIGEPLIEATYFCPDVPGARSECRKPAPGMVLRGAKDNDVDLTRSIFVGDKEIDVQCGHNAGMRAILVLTGHGTAQDSAGAEFVAQDFTDAVRFILEKA